MEIKKKHLNVSDSCLMSYQVEKLESLGFYFEYNSYLYVYENKYILSNKESMKIPSAIIEEHIKKVQGEKTLTIAEMLELIPSTIELIAEGMHFPIRSVLSITSLNFHFVISYSNEIEYICRFSDVKLRDALYQMLIWCLENIPDQLNF